MFPQPSHTKHAPDIRIFTPHVIHRGASDLIPIDSSRSDDDPIVCATGAASIFTSAGLLGAATGAAAATGVTGAFGVSAAATGAYSPPLSSASYVHRELYASMTRSYDDPFLVDSLMDVALPISPFFS